MASEVKDGGEEKVEESEIRRRGKQVRISFWPQLREAINGLQTFCQEDILSG